jgi:hypothetical protein
MKAAIPRIRVLKRVRPFSAESTAYAWNWLGSQPLTLA